MAQLMWCETVKLGHHILTTLIVCLFMYLLIFKKKKVVLFSVFIYWRDVIVPQRLMFGGGGPSPTPHLVLHKIFFIYPFIDAQAGQCQCLKLE